MVEQREKELNASTEIKSKTLEKSKFEGIENIVDVRARVQKRADCNDKSKNAPDEKISDLTEVALKKKANEKKIKTKQNNEKNSKTFEVLIFYSLSI